MDVLFSLFLLFYSLRFVMNPTTDTSESSNSQKDLENRFIELYRRSKDIAEYVSDEELAFVKEHMNQL